MPNKEFKLANIIQKGFTHHKELNPKLFDENQKLNKEVRDQLLVIANDFIDSLNIDHIDFEDIVVIGSVVNYNWNPYSDVDLHVVFDFSEINDDVELVSEFFVAKKSEWNQGHNVKIYGYDVELYGQDINEEPESGGVYSVMKNEWIKKPNPEHYEVSEQSLIKKTKHWMRLIDDVLELDASDQTKINKLKTLKDKLGKFRQSGLEEGGEYSEENLVFKMLRRTGYKDKLSDSRHELEDKVMSLPEGLNLPLQILNTPEKWFKNLLSKTYQTTTPEYPDSIFFKIGDDVYMEFDKNSGYFWYDYYKIYEVLNQKFGLSNNEINKLIKGVVEEHTNLGSVTPMFSFLL